MLENGELGAGGWRIPHHFMQQKVWGGSGEGVFGRVLMCPTRATLNVGTFSAIRAERARRIRFVGPRCRNRRCLPCFVATAPRRVISEFRSTTTLVLCHSLIVG